MILVRLEFTVGVYLKCTAEADALSFAVLVCADGVAAVFFNMCRSDTVKKICIAVRRDLVTKLTVNHSLEVELILALCRHSVDKHLVGEADEALTGISCLA